MEVTAEVTATAPSTVTSAPHAFQFEHIGHHNPRPDVVADFYNRLACKNFAPDTLEALPLWLERLEPPPADGRRVIDWSVLVASLDGVVVGGAVMELYTGCGVGLLPYVVVDASVRGKGLASLLVREAHASLKRQMKETALLEMFIEVAHARGDHAHSDISGTDPRQRQLMWQHMHFFPIAHVDLVHPGVLRGHHHNLCVYRPPNRADSGDQFEPIWTRTVLAFLFLLFEGILLDEGVASDSDEFLAAMEPYETALKPYDRLPVGAEYWA